MRTPFVFGRTRHMSSARGGSWLTSDLTGAFSSCFGSVRASRWVNYWRSYLDPDEWVCSTFNGAMDIL